MTTNSKYRTQVMSEASGEGKRQTPGIPHEGVPDLNCGVLTYFLRFKDHQINPGRTVQRDFQPKNIIPVTSFF